MAEGDKSGRVRPEWPSEARVAEGDKSGRVRPEWPRDTLCSHGACLSIRSVCHQTCKNDVWKANEPLSVQIGVSGLWTAGQHHEKINFWGQELKDT